jgi:hypothetical protein
MRAGIGGVTQMVVSQDPAFGNTVTRRDRSKLRRRLGEHHEPDICQGLIRQPSQYSWPSYRWRTSRLRPEVLSRPRH